MLSFDGAEPGKLRADRIAGIDAFEARATLDQIDCRFRGSARSAGLDYNAAKDNSAGNGGHLNGPSLFRVGNRRYRPAGIPAQG